MRHGQPRCVCAADCRTLLRGHGAVSRGRSGVVRQRRSAAPASSWHGPVCAFDGRTYRNLCALARFNCRSGRDLSVEYIGPCQSQFVTLCLAAEFQFCILNFISAVPKLLYTTTMNEKFNFRVPELFVYNCYSFCAG